MSQERLAEAVGVTFQQIQKYERGANRVSFSRLALIADALETPLSELISGLGNSVGDGLDRIDRLSTPGASELVQAYAAIRSTAVRKCIVELVCELARGASAAAQAAATCEVDGDEPASTDADGLRRVATQSSRPTAPLKERTEHG